MMRRTVLRILLAASALLALWAPAAASGLSLPLPAGTPPKLRDLVDARTETGAADPNRNSVSHEFVMKASHHYMVSVFAEGNTVMIEVERPHERALTAYAVKGTVTSGLVQANFGALGSISMHFQPRRGSVRRRDFCHGTPHTIDRRGTYSGHARIKGENNYVSLAAHRAEGKLETSSPSSCSDDPLFLRGQAASTSSRHHPKNTVKRPRLLFAGWREGVNSVLFAALTERTSTHYVTLVEQSLGRMGIFHFAAAAAPPRVFALDDAITSAKLSGRKPFGGEATYTAAPDGSTSWEGSLSADFPGYPDFPLTGPQFKVEVEAGF